MLTRLFPSEGSAVKLLRPRIPFALNGAHFMLTRLFSFEHSAAKLLRLSHCARHTALASCLTGSLLCWLTNGRFFIRRTKAI
jgi:hypothetical protein